MARLAAAIVACVLIAPLATAVAQETVSARITVGDLSDPAELARLHATLVRTAGELCRREFRGDPRGLRDCIRDTVDTAIGRHPSAELKQHHASLAAGERYQASE